MTEVNSNESKIQEACLALELSLLEDRTGKEPDPVIFKNRITLLEEALNELGNPIPADFGESLAFFPYLERLTQVIAYCSDKETRKLSIDFLKKITISVDPQWRSKIIQWVFDSTTHDSLFGFYVTMVKDSVRLALEEKNPNMMSEFCGPKLRLILKKICQLNIMDNISPGAELLSQEDRVISTLNFLRFLYIRDGRLNESGFQEAMKEIAEDYLKPLESLVIISQQQFNLRLRMVQQGSTNSERGVQEASVIIDGVETFPSDIPIPEQIASLQASVFTLDLMSDLLSRVEECRCTPTAAGEKS